MVNGVQHVIMDGGALTIIMWCADNWDLERMDIIHILVKDQDQYGQTMFTVQDLNQHQPVVAFLELTSLEVVVDVEMQE